MNRLANPLAVCLLFLTAPALAIEPAVRVGQEFQVNTYTVWFQPAESVAVDAAGRFVITWIDYGLGSSLNDVFAQRYQSDGTPAGTAFRVNTYTPGDQGTYHNQTDVAASPDGVFVVVWTSSWQDGSYDGVFAQRFDSAGAPLGTEFQVNSYTTYRQFSPSVAMDGSGSFVVVWTSPDAGTLGSMGIFGQRYDSTGAPAGVEFQVNSYTPGNQVSPSVASDIAGNFVVVWTDYSGLDGSSYSIRGQRFDNTGAALGTEFQVNSYTLFQQRFPSVASDAEGDFVVTWQSYQDGSSSSTQAQRYDSAGNPTGSEFLVNSYTVGRQRPGHRGVFADSDGDFVIAWSSYEQDGSFWGVFGQQFDSTGTRVGSEFQINSYTMSHQYGPAIAGNDQGFVVTWRSFDQDGSQDGAFAQRFRIPIPASCPLAVDGGCTTGFAKGLLLVKEDVAGKEKLVAKMIKGPALAQTALGNPLSGGGTSYALCLYDDAGSLAGSIVVDRAGDDCGSRPCWKTIGMEPPNGKGYKYKDQALTADGVSKLLYKGGDLGRSKVIVKGKGPNLPDGIPAALQTTTLATLQLRASDGICLSVVVDDIKKQTGTFFKAKS